MPLISPMHVMLERDAYIGLLKPCGQHASVSTQLLCIGLHSEQSTSFYC